MTTNAQRNSPTFPEPDMASGTPAASRIVGLLRLVVAALVLASITTQVVDESIHNDFVAKEYFSYFTIQSSLINVVILALSGLVVWRRERESTLLGVFRASVVSYAVVTAVVYNVLLRGLPDEGYIGIQWPNEIIHVWAPLFLFVDWMLSPSRPVLRLRDVRIVIIYPVAWLAFTLVRGTIDGWFPYPFLQPNGPDGWGGVIVYVLGIAAFIIAIALGLIAVSRARWANTDRLWASRRN
ncbi:Pr6Pr family membrane protein [Salinibacterium sp. PAMC 21357]|uniref:Pr6Pr family membrane protein n=1 Tax=Salinibacterium sp. PAMC 21357 TaxID=1112215 RepID=UPI000289E8DD|nr:Pr6Pr family membrane protein [Salinibacterium sp. PAMC 21357]